MMELFKEKVYCLDSNVFIEGWNKYYSPQLCPDYWNVLKELGRQGKIYVPEEVYQEIMNGSDELSLWLKSSKIKAYKKSESVIRCWQAIINANEIHENLVDNTKGRSQADPWVIAHAMDKNAVVVTKENKVINSAKE